MRNAGLALRPLFAGSKNDRYDDERHTLDHVPVHATQDWRKQRLAQAAERHGKPFKCAGRDMPREILTDHRISIASATTANVP